MSQADPSTTGHLIGRLTAAFLLDTIEISRGGYGSLDDLLDNLIFVAIIQANVAPLARDPDKQRAYATYDAPPPDELRQARAVSMNAVAQSLRLPPETVRRRVAHLASEGRCVVTPAGVYVPQWVVSTAEHLAGTLANYELVRRFYRRLRDLGILPSPRNEAGPQGPPPLRAVIRILTDYFLRATDAARHDAGDLVGLMIFLGALRANTEHLPDRPRAEDGQAEDYVPDKDRWPVTAVGLAARLRLPRETVRRNLARMVAQGDCARVPRGVIVPGAALAKRGGLLFAPENLANLNRMFSALDDLGVLALWEADRAAARDSA